MLKRTLWLKIILPPFLLVLFLYGEEIAKKIQHVSGLANAAPLGKEEPLSYRHIADNLYGIDFADGKNGIATGYYGTVLHTQDAGQTWAWSSTGESELLRRVHMTSADNAYAVGHRGTIYQTRDGGREWQAVHREANTVLRSIEFAIGGQVGWAVGSGAVILNTVDGGLSWAHQALTNYKGRDLPTWNGIAVHDDRNVALVGEFGAVAFTDDGGKTWKTDRVPTKTTLTDVAVIPKGYLAVGLDGTAVSMHTEQHGYALNSLETGTKEHFFAVDLNQSGEGFAVGQRALKRVSDQMFFTTEVKKSFELDYTWLGDIKLNALGHMWAVGLRGLIIEKTHGDSKVDVAFRLGMGEFSKDISLRGGQSNE